MTFCYCHHHYYPDAQISTFRHYYKDNDIQFYGSTPPQDIQWIVLALNEIK